MISRIMGLVLAGGEGSRLRPVTLSLPKHLVPLLGKAIIEYPVEQLVNTGVSNIGIVVGYLGHLIEEYLGDGLKYGVRFTYIRQEQRLGIAHAIHLAINDGFIDRSFIVYLGDNILPKGIEKYSTRFFEKNSDVFILLSKVKDPSRFGVAVIRDNKVVKLVEKPKEKISDLAVIGIYYFRDPDMVQRAFSSLRPSWRGEYEITELIQWFIDKGYNVDYDIVDGWWKDVGTPNSLLEALYLLLDESTPKIEGEVNGQIFGRVIVERGAVVDGKVFGPAYIGRGTYIGKNAIVEHYVSLEAGSRLVSGSVSRSLVMNDTIIDISKSRLVDSVIGRRCKVQVKKEYQGGLRLAISDYSIVEL